MIWSGFRPSDDAQVYGYNTAVNMYVFGALVRAMELNYVYWRQPRFARLARDLCGTIKCAASGSYFRCSTQCRSSKVSCIMQLYDATCLTQPSCYRAASVLQHQVMLVNNLMRQPQTLCDCLMFSQQDGHRGARCGVAAGWHPGVRLRGALLHSRTFIDTLSPALNAPHIDPSTASV